MSEPAAEPTLAKLKIDGIEYEVPAVDDFTLGEAVIVKKYTGKNLDELDDISGADPTFLSALILIVLKRADPSVTEANVANIKLTAVDSAGEPEPEEDVRPPAEGSPETEETPAVSGPQA